VNKKLRAKIRESDGGYSSPPADGAHEVEREIPATKEALMFDSETADLIEWR
jgi:hypothetical protein